jgi:hypothetical protein
MVIEYNPQKKTFGVKYYKNETSKRASKVVDYTKEELLEELNDEEPEESGDDPPPSLLDAEENEEVIDTLTECLAALSQNDIGAYLEYFESDDYESCLSDLNVFDDYGSEEEDEVGAFIADATH